MEQVKGKRGRPKGSGINDRETLMKIAAIIAADPSKKRTTAIKLAGISNPSHIRRLRDKFNEQADSLVASVRGSGTAKATASPTAKAEKGEVKATAAKTARKPATKAKSGTKAKAKATGKTAKSTAAKARVRKSASKPAPRAAARKASPKPAAKKGASTRAKPAAAKQAKANGKHSNGKAGTIKARADLAKAGFAMGELPWLNTGVESVVGGIVENQMALYERALKHSPMAAFLRQQALMIDMALSMLKAQQEWTRGRK